MTERGEAPRSTAVALSRAASRAGCHWLCLEPRLHWPIARRAPDRDLHLQQAAACLRLMASLAPCISLTRRLPSWKWKPLACVCCLLWTFSSAVSQPRKWRVKADRPIMIIVLLSLSLVSCAPDMIGVCTAAACIFRPCARAALDKEPDRVHSRPPSPVYFCVP
jgi:hypothetical protein